MSLDHILLGLCRAPTSGYDVKRAMDAGIRHFWSANLNQIYPTLNRLEEKGWLTSKAEASPNGPERRVYRITRAGKTELRRWLRSGPLVGAERFAYIAQLVFMDELGNTAETLAFMKALKTRLEAWQAELVANDPTTGSEPSAVAALDRSLDPETFHGAIAIRMGIHTLAAKIAWCDEAIFRIERRLEGEKR
ncbi:MAG: PadR family transcriptional regulator [Candidatus Eiseniibacteriota bacterium]